MRTFIIDTHVWIAFAKEKEEFDKFCSWAIKNDIQVIIHVLTLFELFRTKYENDIIARERVVSETPHLRYFLEVPIGFVYREFEQEFVFQKPCSPSEFLAKYTGTPSGEEWKEIIRRVIIESSKGSAEWDFHKNAAAFSKVTAKFSRDKTTHNVRDFLEAKNFVIGNKPYKFYDEQFKKYVGKGYDLDGYEKFQSESISKISSTHMDEIKTWIREVMEQFSLEPEMVLDMDVHAFNRRAFYLRHLLHTVEHCGGLATRKTQFIQAMKWKEANVFPGFYLSKGVEELLNKSNARSKTSNKYDTLSLALAPYVDCFVADSAIVEACKQFGRREGILNKKSFYELIAKDRAN